MSLSFERQISIRLACIVMVTFLILYSGYNADAVEPEENTEQVNTLPTEDPSYRFPSTFQAGWSWFQWDEQVNDPIAAMSVASGVLAIVTVNEEIWIKHLDDDEFHLVRRGVALDADSAIGDEELLLEVEDQIEEIVSDTDEEYDEDLYDEDAEEDAQEELTTAIENSAQDAMGNLAEATDIAFDYAGIESGSSDQSQPEPDLGLWVYGDHMWFSSPMGLEVMSLQDETFQKVIPTPIYDLAHTQEGWLAGTQDGAVAITYTDNGFELQKSQTEGTAIYDFLEYPGYGWLAATDDGLWLVREEGWSQLCETDRPVTSMVWTLPGTLMLVTANGIERRSANNQFQSPLKIPETKGFLDLLVLDDMHIMATSAAGVYESVDGGYRYSTLNDGLWADGASFLVEYDASLVLGGENGLYSLNYVDVISFLDREDDFPTLTQLVDTASNRTGLAVDAHYKGAWARLIPSLSVEAYYQPAVSLDWGDGDGTSESPEGDLRVYAGLNWERYTGSEGGGAPVVVDGELYQQRTTDLALVSSRLSHDGRKYRTSLSDQIGKLYTARAALIARELGRENQTLMATVLTQLKIDELEAQISVLVGDWVESSTQF